MGEEAWLFNGYGVVAAFAPRAAAHDPRRSEIGAGDCAMLLQRLRSVNRTAGIEAAGRPHPRAESQLPAAHQAQEQFAHHATARARSSCSSPRTARLSASDV